MASNIQQQQASHRSIMWKQVIYFALIVCQLAAKEAQCQDEKSRLRVLLVRDSTKQQALDEAASLSLDLPLHQETQQQQQERSRRDDNQTEAAATSTSRTGSLGYRQVSLASLTLHQRDPASSGAPLMGVPKQEDPWTELHLVRHRPSWLNVSSRFKITGSSIEEEPYRFPPEFLIRKAFDSPILLKTRQGIVEGVRSIKFNKHLYTFLSVPYAKPPLGELRFKSPEPAEKWDGIYQATKWPPFCVQPSMTLASKSSPVHILSYIMSEDCLYMNIWTPSLKFNKNRKRPVMVWLHGGAFQYGGISVDENDGSALALLGDVVVVTLNYRISAFGFLNANNPKQAPNNVGILDQQLALEWVQANIREFGGDPQQVTLFGESAGGHAVGLHMISPRSQPLFKRAILQSGVPVSFLRSYDVNNDNKGTEHGDGAASIMMSRRLKCYADSSFADLASESNSSSNNETTTGSSTSESDAEVTESELNQEVQEDLPLLSDATIECMRNKSSLEILKALGAPGNAGFFPTGNDPKGVFPNGPVQDSFDPENLKIGKQKDYLIGINQDEGTFMLHYGMSALFPAKSPPKVGTIEELKAALVREIERARFENSSEIQSASGSQGGGAQAHLYRPLLRISSSMLESFMSKSTNRSTSSSNLTSSEFGRNVGSLITDIIFLCPARSLAKTLAENGRNVYFYLYTHRSSQTSYHDWMGVTHHDEVEFVFGRPLRLADVYTGRDIEVSQRMIKTWSHFAYTGQMLSQLGVAWPTYGQEDNNYMLLSSDQASVGQRYHDRVCNIYDTIISVHLQDG